MMNLTDVSWHPLLTSTNAPQGLMPKPGLIYRAFTRIFPVPVNIFCRTRSAPRTHQYSRFPRSWPGRTSHLPAQIHRAGNPNLLLRHPARMAVSPGLVHPTALCR